MNANERMEVYNLALRKWGKTNQLIVAVEELSELQKEITKVLRGEGNPEHLAEEIADVQIMLEQVVFIFKCGKRVVQNMEAKMERLQRRIAK